MSQSQLSRPSAETGRRRHLLSSAVRCHLIGAAVSVALLAAIVFVWSQRNTVETEFEHGDAVVDVAQAARLMQNADSLRQKNAAAFQEAKVIDDRVALIEQWLSPADDWDDAHDDLKAIAETSGIEIVEFDEGRRHVGTRVGIVTATCRIEGSYVGICKFLVAITQADRPIACSEIELQRVPTKSSDRAAQSPCSVTLSLRLPFAAAGSVAANLLPPVTTDAG